MAEKVRVSEDITDDPELDKLLSGKLIPLGLHVTLILQILWIILGRHYQNHVSPKRPRKIMKW